MKSQQVIQSLTQWAHRTFEGAHNIRVEKGEFGGWDVHVEWDDQGYFEEIHHFGLVNGMIRSQGVTEIQA